LLALIGQPVLLELYRTDVVQGGENPAPRTAYTSLYEFHCSTSPWRPSETIETRIEVLL
jgi:hypothetical protein